MSKPELTSTEKAKISVFVELIKNRGVRAMFQLALSPAEAGVFENLCGTTLTVAVDDAAFAPSLKVMAGFARKVQDLDPELIPDEELVAKFWKLYIQRLLA